MGDVGRDDGDRTEALAEYLRRHDAGRRSEGMYVYFRSHLARVLHSGEVDWLVEVDRTYADYARYGAATSPVLASDLVVVLQDREWGYTQTEDSGWLAAFERDTGDLRWKVEWSGREGQCWGDARRRP